MEKERSYWRRILPDLAAFLFGLAAAYFLRWETRDLVWSLWFCSLIVGYLSILAMIGSGIYIGWHVVQHEGFEQKYRPHVIIGGAALALFVIGFISTHFCGFHAGHSVFLNHFFPLAELPDDGLGGYFSNPLKLLGTALVTLLPLYGIFLLPAAVAERKHLIDPVLKAHRLVADEIKASDLKDYVKKPAKTESKKGSNALRDIMIGPYRNVVRMHLLIFFFAGAHYLKLDSFAIYAVVYAVYFFPWQEIRNLRGEVKSSFSEY